MNLTVAIIIVIIALGSIQLFFKRKFPQTEVEAESAESLPQQPELDDTPDLPIGPGYKTQWYAVKTSETKELLQEMRLTDIQTANWRSGLSAAGGEGYYFVSPAVKGWTLIVNPIMPDMSFEDRNNPITVITQLSKRFEEAYYFGTHRVVEYHVWAKAVDGELIRAYGYVGDHGLVLIDQGGLTDEERAHHLQFTGPDAEEPVLPSEEDVLLIAKLWTFDPGKEEEDYPLGTGFIGVME
ncbi:hypothetical protein ACFPYJ_25160 [Paenibacillus solisilvae]|uniref:Uncharacterized protein n=1 Tax=Paenibacillus solisilvae TaxID=2486751 RepID=A0ABW0W2U7_9BACL